MLHHDRCVHHLHTTFWFDGKFSLHHFCTRNMTASANDMSKLGIAWAAGARFDLAIAQLMQGNLMPPKQSGYSAVPSQAAESVAHGDL